MGPWMHSLPDGDWHVPLCLPDRVPHIPKDPGAGLHFHGGLRLASEGLGDQIVGDQPGGEAGNPGVEDRLPFNQESHFL